MGRPKGSKNKVTLMREASRAADGLAPPGVEPPKRAPFDSLNELRTIARVQLTLAAREQQRQAQAAAARGGMPALPKEAAEDDKRLALLLDRARAALRDVVPYEHAPKRPVIVPPLNLDLTRLTNDQLAIFTQLYALASGDLGAAEGGTAATLN